MKAAIELLEKRMATIYSIKRFAVKRGWGQAFMTEKECEKELIELMKAKHILENAQPIAANSDSLG